MKTALLLTYDGTRFHGWQRQKNAITLQECMESALEKVCKAHITLSGCSRTDAGVHAVKYVASGFIDTKIPTDKLHLALNTELPPDIRVIEASPVDDSFDARFSCVSKEYKYLIQTGGIKDPFRVNRAYHYAQPLDIKKMQDAAALLCGSHDFCAFQTQGSPRSSTVREVFYCRVERGTGHIPDDLIVISVRADGFLYNMVRTIAGTLIYCGLGKIDPLYIPEILKRRDRVLAGPTLPPQGLYLTCPSYTENPFEKLENYTA